MDAEIFTLSLTGPDSHRLKREPGVGSLILGPGDGQRRPDLVVAPDQTIHWQVFDQMQTGAGYNWPRHIHYEGNDTALFAWMRQRETEQVTFLARADVTIDARDAKLGSLTLSPGAHCITITLPTALDHLSIMGDPNRVELNSPETLPDITLVAPDKGTLGSVEGLHYLRSVKSLGIHNAVLDTPFDCRSLLALGDLRRVRLHGAMANLDALAGMNLRGLELRFIPNLDGLPDLSIWPELGYFVAWNVEETAGRALKQAIKRLPSGEDNYAGVSQLRSRQWFVEEYGLPFGAWPSKNEKAASKAYKLASKALTIATTQAEAKAVIIAFVQAINALPGIETSEREDTGNAVVLLARVKPDLAKPEEALAWFDGSRDF
ncbi:hypothetical protein [Devosia lacusdianchii]|uniref:hypothetical protein n=1 Tax=Devosia lacusdianchii TaxID=2917991 RepID=UPI001F05ED92|nr:hypothetical protein [Devosia sp. JXJ CY 41]